MEKQARLLGFSSVSEYIRFLHKQQCSQEERKNPLVVDYAQPHLFFNTQFGEAYLGDSLGLLHKTLSPSSVDLIMTSPPFGLVRKKSYGNEDADAYLEWFRPF